MKQKDVDKLINDGIKNSWEKSGWYGFKLDCELYESGWSNMSPLSTQQYCKRIPKKTRVTESYKKGEKMIYEKDKPRPHYDMLRCNWNVCPKIKELIIARQDAEPQADNCI